MSESGTAAAGRLAPGILRAAGLGSHGRVASVTRLAGGSKKGVYRLGCPDGFSAVLYVWSAAEDYWPADAGPADARRADAGPADAGRADAGRADAGRADAGPADARRADARRAGGREAGGRI